MVTKRREFTPCCVQVPVSINSTCSELWLNLLECTRLRAHVTATRKIFDDESYKVAPDILELYIHRLSDCSAKIREILTVTKDEDSKNATYEPTQELLLHAFVDANVIHARIKPQPELNRHPIQQLAPIPPKRSWKLRYPCLTGPAAESIKRLNGDRNCLPKETRDAGREFTLVD